MSWLNWQIVAGVIRHTLTALGGVLITKGYVSDSGWEEIVGAATTIIGFIWSILHKRTVVPVPTR